MTVKSLQHGLYGSLIGGVIFGAMMGMMGMLPMIGAMAGSESAVLGFAVHLVISAMIGVGFVGVVTALGREHSAGTAAGLAYGFAWWILGPLTLMPLLKRFSDSPCTAWARRGTSAWTNAGGPMQAYSMDLRERALLDSDAGMKAADVAVKYRVSGSWVRLLKQRRRETGEVAPRVQRHGRRRMLEPHLHTLAALIAEQPDRTLAELKDALGTPASLATIWRAVAALDVTVKKNGPALRTRST